MFLLMGLVAKCSESVERLIKRMFVLLMLPLFIVKNRFLASLVEGREKPVQYYKNKGC